MAVLVRISATGLDEATYDQISAGLTSLIPEQPGFLMHVAYPVPGGFAVGEVWETQAQQEAWYNGFVLPNLRTLTPCPPSTSNFTTSFSRKSVHSPSRVR